MRQKLLFLLGVMLFAGLTSMAQVELLSSYTVTAAQGSDGLYYLRCDGDCDPWYAIAPINELYRPFDSAESALTAFHIARFEYDGTFYVPIPPAPGE